MNLNTSNGLRQLACLAIILLLTLPCFSQQAGIVDSVRIIEIPAISVVGQRDGVFQKIPGSVFYLNSVKITQIAPISGNEVLRKIPGVHVVDEEGAGLRLNLSVRGLESDRSRSLLVLEDGIPVALNPYGEPELYYTPAIERMSGVELLKGSGQILFGPQTIGGVLNYITSDPPETASGILKITGGQGEMFSGLLNYGSTVGNVGYSVNFLHKQADQIGYVGFNINDLSAKIRLAASKNSSLALKIGVYDEKSDATYLGLTQTMYDRGGQDFVKMAPDDQLTIRRYSASLLHDYRLTEDLKIKTTVFGYTTTRNWRRQDFSENHNAANQTGVVWGDTSVAGGAVFMLNSTGGRNRQFEVAGMESRLNYRHLLFSIENELDFGARLLYERAFEQRVNGKKSDAGSGDLVEDEIRTGRAFSVFLQNRFSVTPRLTLSAGLRVERYDYERNILRNKFNGVVTDTSVVAGSDVVGLLPGGGFTYKIAEGMTVFGGIHKGFAPPRVKDAITNTGEAIQLDAEESWNYELGVRRKLNKLVGFELTGFLLDFSNQIIPVSQSSGGAGAGLVNGGETMHLGVETGVNLDFSSWLGGYALKLDLNGTALQSTFEGDRFLTQGGEQVNIDGNFTPYAPQWLANGSLVFEAPFGWSVVLNGTYVAEQFSDELNTVAPTANGRTGRLPAYWLLDANTGLKIPNTKIRLSFSVKNLTDNRYIVTRRPQGIRLGLPRYLSAGLQIGF